MDYKNELELIRQENKGVLRPRDVVNFARDPNTALHTQFEWDDAKAAEQHRLQQARELIRVVVTTPPKTQRETRVYVSLETDRRNDGGGYRTLDDVMRNDAMRRVLLRQAHVEMLRFAKKYQHLDELASVIEAMQAARQNEPEMTHAAE